MKLLLSKIERDPDFKISSLPEGKVRLTVNGEDPESIWVAKDIKNKKMYLLNHALAFYPFPSWGSEWDLDDSVDVGKARGNTPDETTLILCSESYEPIKDLLEEDKETLSMEKFQKFLDNEKAKLNDKESI